MTEWLLLGLGLAAIFGPGVASILRHRPRGESHREAAARYGRSGYEALRVADEVDAAWRDSLPDLTEPPAPLGLRPDGSIVYLPASSPLVPADAPTGEITGILPTYRGEPL